MIRQYLSNIINDHKTQGERKIQLTMEINFVSSTVSTEYRTMHTTSDNTDIMIGNKQMKSSKNSLNTCCKNYKED